MFTGIIEGLGRLQAREPRGGDLRFIFATGSLPFEAVQLHAADGAAPTFHGRDLFAPAAARSSPSRGRCAGGTARSPGW